MKQTIILIITFMLMVSCRSHKTTQKAIDSSSGSKREELSVATQWLSQLLEYDSSHVVWHLRTDAPFTYHPDTGLRAEKGDLLLAMKAAHWRYFVQDSNDRATYATSSQQHEAQVTLSERRSASRKIVWWMAGILLLLIGGLYFVWK